MHCNPITHFDAFGLADSVSDQWQWHHLLSQAHFETTAAGNPSLISQLGMELADDVNIHSAEYGRMFKQVDHTGAGGKGIQQSQNKMQRQWLMDLKESGVKVIAKDMVDKHVSDIQAKHSSAWNKGHRAQISHKKWLGNNADKLKFVKELEARGRGSNTRSNSKSSGKLGKAARFMGYVGVTVEALSLYSDQKSANEEKVIMRAHLGSMGYSDDTINSFLEARGQLEAFTSPNIPGTLIANPLGGDPRSVDLINNYINEHTVPSQRDVNLRNVLTPRLNPNNRI